MQKIRIGFRVRLGALAPQTQGNCSKELKKQNASYYGPADAHCGKNGTDVSINFLRCLVDLGHHPCRVSDRHGSLCILLYRSDILYIVASVMLYRRDIHFFCLF